METVSLLSPALAEGSFMPPGKPQVNVKKGLSESDICLIVSDSLATPWTVAHQASLSTGFLTQEYWSALPFPSPGDLPNPGIEPRVEPGSPALEADALTSEAPGKPGV